LAFLSIAPSSNAQVDSTTGNLINFTGTPTATTSNWNNAGSVGAPLTCWQGGDPGYCGPNPRVSAWGQGSNVINFSYGKVDLHQIININAGLASVGSNVRLSGFNFGFTAKNGNGWDNGQQDYLSAYVQIYDSKGAVVENYDYTQQTNRRYGWTNFNFNETFAKSYAPSSLSDARVGFVGKDNNFWVGPYGPEIINVSFALKYTIAIDPCVSDPLYSPTCPGYAVATIKNSILGSTVSNASATSYAPATNYTSPAPAAAPPALADTAPALAQVSPQQQAQQPAPQSSPPPQQPGQDPNQNPGVAQDNPAQPSPQQQGPAPTQAQPAGGPPPTATASAPPPSAGPQQAGPQQAGPSGGGPSKLAMSVVKSAQAREQAIQQTAVQNAVKAFEGTQQSSQAASNAAVAMNQDMSANSATAAAQFASQTTQASLQANTQSGQGPQQTQQSTTQQQQAIKSIEITQQIQAIAQQQTVDSSVTSIALKAPDSSQVETSVQSNSGTGLTVSRNPFGYNPLMASATSNMSSSLVVSPIVYQPKLDTRSGEIETPQLQIASFGGTGNPLNEIMMQQRFELMQTSIAQPSSSVNRNVLPNELAGGVDIASMANIPNGFNAYSFVLKDSAFYEPKEVYKNQKTVDNERVLRGLTRGSDSLHQQMVDQQYKSGE